MGTSQMGICGVMEIHEAPDFDAEAKETSSSYLLEVDVSNSNRSTPIFQYLIRHGSFS